MPESKLKLGIVKLRGPAVTVFDSLRDDNHAEEADAAAALENFRLFSDDFFAVHRDFVEKAESFNTLAK